MDKAFNAWLVLGIILLFFLLACGSVAVVGLVFWTLGNY